MSNQLDLYKDKILSCLATKPPRPWNAKELRKTCLQRESEKKIFKDALRRLRVEKKITKLPERFWVLSEHALSNFEGTIRILQRGEGIVALSTGERVYIRRKDLKNARSRDQVKGVLYPPLPSGKK